MKSRIFKNTSSYMLAGMLPNFVNLVMLPVYTRYLDPADYGIVSLVTSFTTFLQVFLGLQMGNSLERLYFDYEGDRLKEFFSTILFGTLILNVAMLLPVHLLGDRLAPILFPKVDLPYRPYLMLGLFIIFCRSLTNYFNLMLRIQERGVNLMINSVINTALGIVLGVYFVVVNKMGAYGVLLGQALSSAAHLIVLRIVLHGYIRPVLKASLFRPALHYSLPLIPHALGGILFIYSDRYILGFFVSLGAIGLYDLADKIALVLKIFIGSFNSATLPTFMRMSSDDKEAARLFYRDLMTRWCAIMAAMYLGMSLFAEELILWVFPEKYAGAYVFVSILLGAYVFRGLYGFSITSVMYEKKTFVFPMITFSAGILNIAANIALIPIFGVIAAAWTTLLSYALTFVLALYFSNKYYPLLYETRKIIVVFAAAFGIFLLIQALPEVAPWIKFIAKIGGVSLFGAYIWFTDAGGLASEGRKLLRRQTGL